MLFVTARKRSCGKVMFLHLSVSHSVRREGRESLYDVTVWLFYLRDLCRSTLRRYVDVVYLLQTEVLPDDEPFTEDYCETSQTLR